MTFGDSTTDSGVAYQLSNHTWPPVPPFNSNGGFADGPLWNQIFVQTFLFNAILQNFACGSASTDSLLAQGVMGRNPNLIENYTIRNNTKSPGVRQQIAQYINSTQNKTIDFDRTLFIIWTGTNNYFFNKSLTTSDTAQSIIDCLNLLITFGGRHLVIINEPPFDRFPAFRDRNETNVTKNLYIDHNAVLARKFNENYLSLNDSLHIQLFDSYSLISNIMDNYTNYGLENLDSCWDTTTSSTVQVRCRNIRQRMFCDEYHLTSHMQSFIAEELYHSMVKELSSMPLSGITSTPTSKTIKTAITLGPFIYLLINIFLLK